MSLEPFLERIQPFPVAALVAVAEDLPDAAATEEDRPGKDEDDLNELFSATYNEGFRRAGAGLPSAVGVLRARGLPEDAAVALLVPWASVHFRPALPDEEVERHIRSMYARYGMPAKGLPLLYPLTAEESQHA